MKRSVMYPCSKTGKILKGFCPSFVSSDVDVYRTYLGLLEFSAKFGIKYYFLDGSVYPLK